MANYLAQRIIDGVFEYIDVINKYPNRKEEIDTYLSGKGREDLIEVV